jgi:hypothetical protein
MEPEGSLPHSQQPATCPYPEQLQNYKLLQNYFVWNIVLVKYDMFLFL